MKNKQQRIFFLPLTVYVGKSKGSLPVYSALVVMPQPAAEWGVYYA